MHKPEKEVAYLNISKVHYT